MTVGAHILLLAQNRGEAADLGSECSTDVLRAVRHQILDRAHDLVEKGIPVDQSAEARDLASDRRPHLGLAVFEQLYKGGDQIPGNNLLINRLGDLDTHRVSSQSRVGNSSQRYRTFSNLSAIMYRTLQLLSSIKARSEVRRTP